MAKTLAQIKTDIRNIIGEPDVANSHFTDAQLTIWINDAYRRICIALRHLPITATDYTVSAQSVSLNLTTITIDQAKLQNPDVTDSNGSKKYDLLTIISLDELLKRDPDYENATADMPEFLVRKDVATIVLYPPPKASVIALTTPLRTYGLVLPTELSADGDQPSLPPNLHDIMSHWGAYRCFSALNNIDRSTEQLTIFRGALKEQKEVSTEFSRHLNRWRWDDSI